MNSYTNGYGGEQQLNIPFIIYYKENRAEHSNPKQTNR